MPYSFQDADSKIKFDNLASKNQSFPPHPKRIPGGGFQAISLYDMPIIGYIRDGLRWAAVIHDSVVSMAIFLDGSPLSSSFTTCLALFEHLCFPIRTTHPLAHLQCPLIRWRRGWLHGIKRYPIFREMIRCIRIVR